MVEILTMKGIDQALSNLAYWEKRTVKSRLLHLVRNCYGNGEEGETPEQIDPDELIKAIWGVHDPVAVRKRRRNLFSIKSSVNTDLQRLYESGRNPEGITLGPDNVFRMSDAAKDQILENFSDAVKGSGGASLDQVTKVLEVVKAILSDPRTFPDSSESGKQEKLDQLKELVRSLSSHFGTEPSLPQIPRQTTETDMPGNPEELDGDARILVEDLEKHETMDQQWGDAEYKGMEGGLPETDRTTNGETISAIGDDDVTEEIEEIIIEEALEVLTEEEEDFQQSENEEEGEYGNTSDPQEAGFEIGLPVESLGQPIADGPPGSEGIDRARLLSEEFDGFLGAMDRFYNQYLLIPEGKYRIGATAPREHELPERIVNLSAFYMGKFPVTNALFEIFVEKTGYRTTAEKVGYGTVYEGRYRKTKDPSTGKRGLIWQSAVGPGRVEGACWYQPLGPGSNLHGKRHHPVVQVSLEDAAVFAAWTGKRLPSEEEWEAAARAPEGYLYPWGNKWEEGLCNLEPSREGDTTAVDRFVLQANELGIADALGNVLEWTQDPVLSHSSVKNDMRYYVAKGGCWLSSHECISLSARYLLEPDSHSNILGFRCLAF